MCNWKPSKSSNFLPSQFYTLRYIFSHNPNLYDNVEMVLNEEDLYYLAAEHMDCNVYNAMCSVCNTV